MKLKYIFASIVATLALAVGCEKEADHYLSEIQVSTSYVSLATTGESNTAQITVTASDSWSISMDSATEKWLTVSPATGGAGETTVTFTAAAGEGKSGSVKIVSGTKTQWVNVIQGVATISTATCAEVIAGPDSKNYRVTGVVTSIVNTTYGNWYLNDGTGEVYIYGTLDSKGATKNFLSWGLEVGDEITVEGPKTTYNGTVELVDVTVVKINKSLIKVDDVNYGENLDAVAVEGGDVDITISCKGNGIDVTIPESAKTWLGVTFIDNSEGLVRLSARPNEGGDRSATVTFITTDGRKDYTAETIISQKGAIVAATVKEFIDAEETSTIYRVSGVITEMYASDKQNKSFYIRDWSGEVLIYRAEGFDTSDAKVGDVVTVTGVRTSYKETPQMGTAKFESLDHPVTEISIASFLEEGQNSTWYRVTGTVTEIANESYGNIYITDGTKILYIYGCYPGVGATGDARKGVVAAKGIKVGDKLTVFGPRSVYNGTPQVNGGFFWSLEKGGSEEPDPEEPGTDEPGTDEPGQFDTNVTCTTVASAYTDGVINVTHGETSAEGVFTLKLGSSSKYGSATITLPAGTTAVKFYGIAWKGSPATLKFSVGETVIGTQDLSANDGASGSSPYTATVADSDYYTVTLPEALTAETEVKVETVEGTNTGCRAILFGIQAVN